MPSPAASDLAGDAEAHGVTEEIAHRPPWRVDRRLAERRVAEAARVEPGAMRAGQAAREIGDGGDHGGPRLGRAHARRAGSSSAGGSAGFRFRAKP